MEPNGADPSNGAITERRISWLTLLIGFGGAALVALWRDRAWGAGLAIGSALAWLNFRWLKQGLNVLATASTAQAGKEKPKVPTSSYIVMALRYGLIALVVYVIFVFLKVPLLSMVVGLCALGAATIAASVYEIWRPAD